ncbi:conserved hypothetical protein [Culex quinquefasciatus]|uniref:Uncharacterized protein n=1 Tax=Culex quinquefasciatus TaxID=7176 RepID=B0XED3_CULQU|nr:conserved hypothetical protein [Culex quinquefasciatus]|eukprot:XP_001868005.1 conserved hypothetical protein [Culex quinquefasciatus]
MDTPSQSLHHSIAESSSHQDVDASIDGDDSRRSVEPDELEMDSPPQDKSTSRRSSSYTEPTTPQKESPKKQSKGATPGPEAESSNTSLLAIAGVVIVVVAAVAIAKLLPSKPQVQPQHCDQFVTQLRPKYPTIDPMLWTTLNVSVNRALYRKPGEPSTFVFLYDSATVRQSLVEDIIGITSKCFDNTRPIRLTSADFETPDIAADYSAFLHRYKPQLEERGIMVVQDLDQVPAKAARALFTICDSYGPLVERAVIFFTIDISRRAEEDPDQSPTAIAEKLLQDQWRNGLKVDTLVPLLVRLTENVFKII